MDSKALDCPTLSAKDRDAGERRVILIGAERAYFRWCRPGMFMMGSPKSKHEVTLSKGFWIMETPVTVGMFEAFVTDSPYKPKGAPWIWIKGINCKPNSEYSWDTPGYDYDNSYPVTCVRWEAAKAFCEWLSDEKGLTMRLPTEAEWEYACRAGNDSFAESLDEIAWHFSNSAEPGKSAHPHPVATRKPNALGIYDMHGNVWEWCQDWYEEFSNKSVTNPTGPKNGTSKVIRGGSWASSSKFCRSVSRLGRYNHDRWKYSSNYTGFRVVCECEQQ